MPDARLHVLLTVFPDREKCTYLIFSCFTTKILNIPLMKYSLTGTTEMWGHGLRRPKAIEIQSK